MKLLIASDIHGAAAWCRKLVDAADELQPDRLLLLGDILYHGPRNDLPADYAPKEVAAMLNGIADSIIAVRGNCDAEVDQMVLDFECMADYALLFDEAADCELFATHGHVYGPGLHNSIDRLPTLGPKAALVYGHTHCKVNEAHKTRRGLWLFNPGSIGLPKDASHSCGVYENGSFSFRTFD